jgi:hypothetical protein
MSNISFFKSDRRSNRLRIWLLPLTVFVALMGCSGASSDAAPLDSSPQALPLDREGAMNYFAQSTRKLCGRDGFLELVGKDQQQCLAYIDRAHPVCDEEALLAMPASFKSAEEARGFGLGYVRCLSPPLVAR